MAVHAGHAALPEAVLNEVIVVSTNLALLGIPESTVTPFDVSLAVAGALTDNLPVDQVGQVAQTGTRSHAFSDDYYFRIHVTPVKIDLGNVISQQVLAVEVWNAFFSDQNLASIDVTDPTGINLVGPIAPPTVFTSLESREYTLTVDEAGPPVIDTTYTLNFATESPTLLVIGQRVVLLVGQVNWDDGVKDRYEWLTDVITSYDGTEQRIKLRGEPRREVEVHLQAFGVDAVRRLESTMFGWQSRSFVIPYWPDFQVLGSVLAMGSTTITGLDTADSELVNGGIALLFATNEVNETVQVVTVNANDIVLGLPTQQEWPAGTKLFTGKFVRMQTTQKFTRPTRAIIDMRAKLTYDDNQGLTAVEGTPLYLTYPVLLYIPNEVEDLEDELLRPLLEFDSKTFRPALDDPIGHSFVIRRVDWIMATRKERADFRKWLYARSGRWKPFWMPSWNRDFEITRVVTSTATQLFVKFGLYTRFVSAAANRNHLMIQLHDGTLIFREILSIVEDPNGIEEIVDIDSGPGVTIQVADVNRICYLNLSRMDSDAIDIFHETDTISTVSALVRTVVQ